jgi:hypothetical protein
VISTKRSGSALPLASVTTAEIGLVVAPRSYAGSMTAALKLRPGVIEQARLDDLARTLDRTLLATVGSVSRLVGPDGQDVELPEKIVDLLRVLTEQLLSGNAISVATVDVRVDRTASDALDARTTEAQELGLYDD